MPFVIAYTAPPVDYASGPIVAVIVIVLCLAVALALFFSSPLATRLIDRDAGTRARPPADPDEAAEPGRRQR